MDQPFLPEEIYNNSKFSVCRIKNNNNGYGTGFFCQIPDPEKQNETMIALLTCNHVIPINKDNPKNCEEISFQLCDREFESLCLVDGRRIWLDKEINDNDPNSYGNLDYTCIEIFSKYKEELGIFKIDEQTLNNQSPEEFEKLKIKSYTFKEKVYKELIGDANGLELKRKNYFYHSLDTEEGYSGSPIINNINGNIIGIHMGKNKSKSKNQGIGMILKKIYNHMKKNSAIKLNKGYPNPYETQLYNHKIFQIDISFNGYNNPNKTQLCQRENKIIKMIKQPPFISISIIIVIAIIIIFIITQNISSKNNFEYFYNEYEYNKEYKDIKYYNKSCHINETGNYNICVYGAEANPGGRGGKVCVYNEHFEKNDKIEYNLGSRHAGGKRGINCGNSRGNGYNGAGLALAKYKNNILLIAGGGGGNSESGNIGGDAEGNGNGKYGGFGGNKDKPGKGGYNSNDNGKCMGEEKEGKGGKGGEYYKEGYWCGGGGGDGYCGGGGGGFGKSKEQAGGGGGGSNYCSSEITKKCSFEINEESHFSGIKIIKVD